MPRGRGGGVRLWRWRRGGVVSRIGVRREKGRGRERVKRGERTLAIEAAASAEASSVMGSLTSSIDIFPGW